MKKSRILSLLLAALMLTAFFAACTPAAQESNAPATDAPPPADEEANIVFSLWGDPSEQATTQKALDVFNELPEVKGRIHVEALQIGRDEYNETLQTRATGSNMPDCGMVAEDTVIGWSRSGLLMPIDIFEGQADKPLDSITFKDNGKTIAYSSANEILCLWYNKKMFDDAGIEYPPAKLENAWTWDQFIAVAKQLTFDANGNHPGDAGFDKNSITQYGAYVNQYTWQLETWSLANGGRWFSPDGTQIVFDDAAIEGMQKVIDLHLVENVAPLIDGTEDNGFGLSLGAGNVAMCTEGAWATGFRAAEINGFDGTDIDYGVAVLPKMANYTTICTGGPVGVFATSKYADQAAEFLRWYTSEENSLGTIEAGWWMPTKSNWYTDEALIKKWVDDMEIRAALPAADYRSAVVAVALNNDVTKSTGWYYTPNTYEVINLTLQPAMVEAITGAKTVKEVVEASRSAMEAALAG